MSGQSILRVAGALSKRFFVFLFLAASGSFLALHAQVLYGSLSGVVTDSSGAAIPNASVEAVESQRGIHQQAATDASGLYRFSELLPGNWKITVTAQGFGPVETDNIRVDPNTVTRIDEKLSVGKVQQSVTVTGAPPLLQTDRADIHTDLSTAELQQLPTISSEGKNFQDLLRIVPGSTIPVENNSAAGNPERAMTANVNGQSTQGNDTRIDGILDAYPWLPNNVAYVPPEDAVQTVNITTNSYDAEQGMVNGAEINVQTKTGTNHLHGDAYEFHTDDDLKAINYFEPPTFKRPENIFNQFGGSAGGPILKDKLFFFADYQGTRQVLAPAGGNPQTVPFGSLVYNTAESAGYFDFRPFQTAAYGLVDASGNPVHIYDPNTGNPDGSGRTPISCNGVVDTICLSRVDPAALAMAKLIPAPTSSLATLDSNNYLDTQKGFFHTDDYDAKVNFVPSQQTTVFGHFSTSRGDIYDPPSLGAAEGNATNGGQLGNATTRIYVIGFGGTHTFTPNLLLDGNLGFTRQHLAAEAPDIAEGPVGLNTLKIPGTNNSQAPSDNLYYGIPAFQFVTFTNLGNPNTGNPFVFRDNQYVENENLTWVKGNHQLRFGGEWDHVQMNHFQPQGGTFQTARGTFGMNGTSTEQVNCTGGPPITKETCTNPDPPTNFQYGSYADFLLGLPYEDGKAVQDTDPIALRWSYWAVYARDLWQVSPKLSLDYGLRWEFYPMAYSDHGKGARVLDPSTMQVLVGGYGSVPQNDGVQVGHGEFLPRIGIDYKATQNTVVRAGFGIGADSNNWRYLRNDYPADTISSYSGTNTGGTANFSAAAPSDSLSGTNATGPYSTLPVGIVLIATPNLSTGSIPLPNNITTSTVGQYPNFRRGYIYSYNLTIEQQFAGFVGDAAYVGEREIRPILNMNLNSAPAGGGAAGEQLNAKFGGTWGSINTLVPAGHDYYDALQTKLTRRFGQSSTIGVLYTWSKTEDFEDNEELSSISWPYPAYFARNKALAGYDRDYNFEGFWLYSLPFGKGQKMANHGVASALAGGWTFSGVLSRLGGAPFTVTDNSAAAVSNLNAPGNQQTPNLVAPIHVTKGRPAYSPSLCPKGTDSCSYFDITSFQEVPADEPATFGNAGRDIIRGPGYFDVDANLFRNFKITEFLTFQFEADAFGVTNTPHFANPDANITDGNFGKVTGESQGANSSLGGSGGERLWYFGGKFIF
ncbi:MAG TPA: TonB-dependent receptor [Acidobacteriaceae bacterium]|nr:TonB-dependent receptor [Acidobacteriaceae bacterium]